MAELEDDDVEFGDVNEMQFQGISQARWDRAKKDVDIRDLIFQLYGKRGNPISCPFHGRDSKPSFYFFLENNDCTCYGCAEGDNYWDTIKVVTKTLEITRSQAVRWLEREYNLPPLADEADVVIDVDAAEEAEDEEPAPPLLTVEELRPHYEAKVRRLLIQSRNEPLEHLLEETVPNAQMFLRRFFESEHYQDPYMLAHVVGAETVRGLIRTKQAKA